MTRTIEAFAAYHRHKELLTDYLQVSSGGLALLRRNIDVPNAPVLLGAFVDACGVKHWGKGKHYRSAVEKVDAGIAALGEQGVIQHVAAFDVFTRSAVQDASRFCAQARNGFKELNHRHELLRLSSAKRWVSHHCCNDVATRLGPLSKRLGELKQWISWTPSQKLSPTLPLFDLIRSIRNRIAHDGGIVGADLAEISGSPEVAAALVAFRSGYARRDLPPLPQFVRGQSLRLDAVHAILFGAFLYEIAKEVNVYIASLLVDDEFIDMAFYYSSLVEEHPFRTVRHRSAENRVCYFLTERYLREANAPGPERVIKRLASQIVVEPGEPAHDTTYWKVALARHKVLRA